MRNRPQDRTYASLAITLALCFLVTMVHNRAERNGHVDIFTSKLRAHIIAPTAVSEVSVAEWTESSVIGTLQAAKTARENTYLHSKLDRIVIENQLLRQQLLADNQIRKTLNSPLTAMPNLIVGNVVSLKPSPARDNALVAVGNGAVIHERQIVLGPSGAVVGQVVDSDHGIADVMLVTDSLSSVGARVIPVNRAAPSKVIVGICQGDRNASLNLVDLPSDSDVRVGDNVVTSGLGGVYPPGIPLGKVKSVRLDVARSIMTATVEPTTDVNDLQEVFLLP